MHWLDLLKITPYGFKMEKNKLTFEKGYHSSGHASLAVLEKVVDDVDPDVIIPVHTEKDTWFKTKFKKKNVQLLENGMTYSF